MNPKSQRGVQRRLTNDGAVVQHVFIEVFLKPEVGFCDTVWRERGLLSGRDNFAIVRRRETLWSNVDD